MVDMPHKLQHEIGTVSLPAYLVLYRNPRGSGRWYVHRGFTMEADALEVASSLKRVQFDCIVLPLTYDEKELKILNAF